VRTIFLYIIYKIFWNFFFKIIIGVRYIGEKKLIKHQQFVMVANHNSHADGVTLMTSVPVDRLAITYPVAAEDYFGKSKLSAFLSWFLINLLLIPRKRDEKNPKRDPISILDSYLKNGKSLIFFPEGSRGKAGKIQGFKKGLGYLMKENMNIPIIPVYLEGIGRVLPKGNKIMLPGITKIYFGNPIFLENESVEEIVGKAENAVHDLKNRCDNNNSSNLRE
jgi:1-acyl-sn-glycerol-3-phosphate acyltransferase